MGPKFTDDDVEKVKKFINLINEKMVFVEGLKISDIPTIYSSLAWIQKRLIPVMEANVLEVLPHQAETKADRDERANAKD